MNLDIDSTGTYFIANYPYPNQKCTVTFVCDAGGAISTDIIATSYHYYNSWPY